MSRVETKYNDFDGAGKVNGSGSAAKQVGAQPLPKKESPVPTTPLAGGRNAQQVPQQELTPEQQIKLQLLQQYRNAIESGSQSEFLQSQDMFNLKTLLENYAEGTVTEEKTAILAYLASHLNHTSSRASLPAPSWTPFYVSLFPNDQALQLYNIIQSNHPEKLQAFILSCSPNQLPYICNAIKYDEKQLVQFIQSLKGQRWRLDPLHINSPVLDKISVDNLAKLLKDPNLTDYILPRISSKKLDEITKKIDFNGIENQQLYDIFRETCITSHTGYPNIGVQFLKSLDEKNFKRLLDAVKSEEEMTAIIDQIDLDYLATLDSFKFVKRLTDDQVLQLYDAIQSNHPQKLKDFIKICTGRQLFNIHQNMGSDQQKQFLRSLDKWKLKSLLDAAKPDEEKAFIICQCNPYKLLDAIEDFKFVQQFDYDKLLYLHINLNLGDSNKVNQMILNNCTKSQFLYIYRDYRKDGLEEDFLESLNVSNFKRLLYIAYPEEIPAILDKTPTDLILNVLDYPDPKDQEELLFLIARNIPDEKITEVYRQADSAIKQLISDSFDDFDRGLVIDGQPVGKVVEAE